MSDKAASSFHQELFLHLSKEVEKKFQQSEDESLALYWEKIQSAIRKNENHNLAEMLKEYHALLEKEHLFPIEKKLFDHFTTKKIELKMSRGLPRLYKKDNPSKSKIKPEFASLPDLKKLALEKHTLRNFASFEVPKGTKISLFTYVYSDGLGDLVALKETKRILSKEFPDLQFQSTVLVPEKFKDISLLEEEDHLIFYGEKCPPELLTKKTLEDLKNSDLIISIPTHYPYMKELKRQVQTKENSPNFLSIGQYGFLESSWFHPQSGAYSMGLHFLEKGIFIREKKETADFRSISDKNFLQSLFGTQSPKTTDIEAYKKRNRLYFAYLLNPLGGAIYLHTLLELEKKSSVSVDICSPNIHWLIELIKKQRKEGLPLLMEDFNIKEIEIHYQNKVHRQKLKSSGKILRIISPSSINDEDFREILHLSSEFVAVRGDQSFSEVISANKLFFYDGASHAKYFIKDLVALAENKLQRHLGAVNYFRLMQKAFLSHQEKDEQEWVEETYFHTSQNWVDIAKSMAEALKSKGILTATKALNEYIQKEHSFNETLSLLIRREISKKLKSDSPLI